MRQSILFTEYIDHIDRTHNIANNISHILFYNIDIVCFARNKRLPYSRRLLDSHDIPRNL